MRLRIALLVLWASAAVAASAAFAACGIESTVLSTVDSSDEGGSDGYGWQLGADGAHVQDAVMGGPDGGVISDTAPPTDADAGAADESDAGGDGGAHDASCPPRLLHPDAAPNTACGYTPADIACNTDSDCTTSEQISCGCVSWIYGVNRSYTAVCPAPPCVPPLSCNGSQACNGLGSTCTDSGYCGCAFSGGQTEDCLVASDLARVGVRCVNQRCKTYAIPYGGVASNPQGVSCGGSACAAVANAGCCMQLGDGGGSCIDSQNPCVPPNAALECDEAANCPTGTVCCDQWGSGAFSLRATCLSSCPTQPGSLGAQVQACRTHAECVETGKCTVRSCGGFVLETCASTAACP